MRLVIYSRGVKFTPEPETNLDYKGSSKARLVAVVGLGMVMVIRQQYRSRGKGAGSAGL